MSLAQELNELGNNNDRVKKYKERTRIPFRDLEIGKKYKVYKLTTFKWNCGRTAIHVDINDDGGFLDLADSYKDIAAFIKSKNVENIYVIYSGQGKRNRAIIHFYEGDELIELEPN